MLEIIWRQPGPFQLHGGGLRFGFGGRGFHTCASAVHARRQPDDQAARHRKGREDDDVGLAKRERIARCDEEKAPDDERQRGGGDRRSEAGEEGDAGDGDEEERERYRFPKVGIERRPQHCGGDHRQNGSEIGEERRSSDCAHCDGIIAHAEGIRDWGLGIRERQGIGNRDSGVHGFNKVVPRWMRKFCRLRRDLSGSYYNLPAATRLNSEEIRTVQLLLIVQT